MNWIIQGKHNDRNETYLHIFNLSQSTVRSGCVQRTCIALKTFKCCMLLLQCLSLEEIQCIAVENTSRLMPLREIISLYCENYMKPINTLCGQNAEISMLKQVVRTVIPGLYRVNQVRCFPAIRTGTRIIGDTPHPHRYIQGDSRHNSLTWGAYTWRNYQ